MASIESREIVSVNCIAFKQRKKLMTDHRTRTRKAKTLLFQLIAEVAQGTIDRTKQPLPKFLTDTQIKDTLNLSKECIKKKYK